VACDIPQSEWPKYTAALSEKHFQSGLACGATARIQNGTKEIEVMIVDLCPVEGNEQWCSGDLPHFDLGGSGAFGQLENVNTGVKEVQVEWVATPVGDLPVKLRLKDGVNKWWVAVQVLNHRYPVAKIEIKDPQSGAWITGAQKADLWNYRVFTFTGNGLSTPYQLRITDQFGQAIEETGTTLQENAVWSGTHQFPVYKSAVLPPPYGPDRAHGATVSGRVFIAENLLHCALAPPVAVAVVDMRGKRVGRMNVASQAGAFRLPALPTAVYYVKVSNAGSASVLRWACVK
jgi:expansin (peptidoglycan-binding protein)